MEKIMEFSQYQLLILLIVSQITRLVTTQTIKVIPRLIMMQKMHQLTYTLSLSKFHQQQQIYLLFTFQPQHTHKVQFHLVASIMEHQSQLYKWLSTHKLEQPQGELLVRTTITNIIQSQQLFQIMLQEHYSQLQSNGPGMETQIQTLLLKFIRSFQE